MQLAFEGNRRFQIIRLLGKGGMGAVYEVFDRKQQGRFAVKTLLKPDDPEDIQRFKDEFRALADIRHPNLVSLEELVDDGGQWYIVMELVDGVDLVKHIRPSGDVDQDSLLTAQVSPALEKTAVRATTVSDVDRPAVVRQRRPPNLGQSTLNLRYDEVRLRAVLKGLAAGLVVLHQAGKVHCDIKPSNVLVTPEGRVVILDFGLVRDLSRPDRSKDVAGTLAYMAPEQAQPGMTLTPAADWYSVGVVLYQALTGMLPFEGGMDEVLMAKQRSEPPAPKLLYPAIPEDLNQLCVDLLRIEPHGRPKGVEILHRVGCDEALVRQVLSAASSSSITMNTPFVGRARELATLGDGYDRSRAGHAVKILVHGDSGVGKTALLRKFTEQVRSDTPECLVLETRCHERESVPFKAVDGDGLANLLLALSKSELKQALPARSHLLLQVFPGLRRVESIVQAEAGEPIRDPYALRVQLFAALRELLQRIARLRPMIILVNDLQWADEDSWALLGEVLGGGAPPPLLFLATVRTSDGTETQDLSTRLKSAVENLTLEPLPPATARELASRLLHKADPASAQAIAEEAGGHPLFIGELVKYQEVWGRSQEKLHLEDVLWSRIARLTGDERRLLILSSLSSIPLLQSAAMQAAELSNAEFRRTVATLRAGRLLHSTGNRENADVIEPVHDRIRAAVLEHTKLEDVVPLHARLAVALESTGLGLDEAIARHWLGAGDARRAAKHAAVAGEQAFKALAFERAARLYHWSLELDPLTGEEGRKLRIGLADALANAGRAADAAHTYVEAARDTNETEVLELHRRACEQFLISGHIDEGLNILHDVLGRVNLPLKESQRDALMSFLTRRLQARLRGLRFKERHASEISAKELRLMDICWSVALSLSVVDTLRGGDYQTRHLILALESGELYRIARALAMEAGYSAIYGGKTAVRTEKLLQEAKELAERIQNPHALGLARVAATVIAYLSGRFHEAVEHGKAAQEILRDRCVGVTSELDKARLYPAWAMAYLGDLNELESVSRVLLKEANERGDLYLETSLMARVGHWPLLAVDDADGARRCVDEAIDKWTHAGFHLQHHFALLSNCEIDLYQGDGQRVLARLDAADAAINGAQLLHMQMARIEFWQLRARAHLAIASVNETLKAPHVATATKLARKIEKERMPWSTPLAHLLFAGVANLGGDRTKACRLLEKAAAGLDGAKMGLFAAAARYHLGMLATDSWTSEVRATAEKAMASQGVRAPERMSSMLAPGLTARR